MTEQCAVIAGAGQFPFYVAAQARRQGLSVVAIGLKGWVEPTLAGQVDVYEEVAIGQLGRLIERLASHRVRRVVMAGKVTKEVLFDPRVNFDAEALAILSRANGASVNALLGAMGERLAQEGIELIDSSTFLRQDLCPTGVVSRRSPAPEEEVDIEVGSSVARKLAELDIGQTVVVKRQVVVAVEALEGTDAAIRRAGQLAGGDLTVVKMASPAQDLRFDLPILGPATIAVAAEAGVRCIAVEAGKTLLLDKDRLLAQADAQQIGIVGITQPHRP
ncbi:MAG: UDP-2,3-diacylglucosamine diphosphatase LpxI [Candidatus Omnitrophica bacterium]|nr:UDP-2,3-diacylglucosamine diphosphatase LpxI [Candidatus Omnitrophota bacterium]